MLNKEKFSLKILLFNEEINYLNVKSFICSNKKMGEMERDKLLIYVFIAALVLVLPFIIAASTLNSIITNGNYSTTLVFNCTTDLENPLNATLYYNASGGAATTALVTMTNDTASDTEFYNGSVNISGLASETSTYNITCLVDNSTIQEYSGSATSVTIDNTPPAVATFSNTINNGNYSGTRVINVTANDSLMGVESVYFNITNSSGIQLNFTKASNSGVIDYNISLNTTGFTDGKYNITVFANDTQLNNLNNSEKIQITIDNTNPSVTLSKANSTTSSFGINISISDSTSGVNSTCSTNRGTVSGSGTNQTLTESGLSCGTSYSYTVTCIDRAGNSGPSSPTSFTTDLCSSSSSGGGGGSITPLFWKNTFVEDDKELSDKVIVTRELSEKQRVRIRVDGKQHYVGIINLTSSTAVINVSSTPQQATFSVGAEKKFEVTNDTFYDILVRLDSVNSSVASVSILSINDEISAVVESSTETESSITGSESDTETEEGTKLKISDILFWIVTIILFGIIIYAAYVGGKYFKEKYQNKANSKVKIVKEKMNQNKVFLVKGKKK